MSINKLSIEYNLYCIEKISKEIEDCLPNKTEFPLIHKIMRPSASQYFETNFNVSNGFYPYLESTLSHRKKTDKWIRDRISFNFIKSLIAYVFKKILIHLINKRFVYINFEDCSFLHTVGKKNSLIKNIYSSPINLKLNLFYFRANLVIKRQSFFHKLIVKSISSPINPNSILLIYLLTIEIRLNSNNIKKIKKKSLFFLRIIESSLRKDYKLHKNYIKNLYIKNFYNDGWYSSSLTLVFDILNELKIKSIVYAHGHLSQPTLCFYYPVKASEFIVLTKEEANRVFQIYKRLNIKKIPNIKYSYDPFNNKLECIKNKNFNFLRNIKRVIIGFSGGDYLLSQFFFYKYSKFVKDLLEIDIEVFYRAHRQDNKYIRKLLSVNNLIESYSNDLTKINKTNTIILGSSTSLLIDAYKLGIVSFEISDFSTNCSGVIKSLECFSIKEFIDLLDNK